MYKRQALNDVLFLNKDDFLAHQAKVSINNATLLKDEMESTSTSEEQYFKSSDEMAKLHSSESMHNAFEVAKLCNLYIGEGQYFLPSYELEKQQSLGEYLKVIAKEKLDQFLSKNDDLDKKLYLDRLDKELKIIIDKDYPGYFLIVMDFVLSLIHI